MISITINGEQREIDTLVTITAFLEKHALHARMVVVEHNGDIIPRDRYSEVVLQDGDNLEIVQMMAGG
jgi:thiamine biosynthesis protein ThiS